MDITIQSVRFNAAEHLQQFVQQKVTKLEHFFDGIVNAEVILRLDKSDSAENKIAEIKLKLPGGEIFSKKQTKSFEESVDLACDALRKQLLKWKEKVRTK
ncbi:MAG: ribosome-associated translation inhibitor RaiA [Chlorobi bacterium]|nr:ribosome-associated translation inhibitor RaiA [Chlorobiota bacterium]